MNEQLFHLTPSGVTELPSNSQSIKPKMKKILDEHLESYLGVRFVTQKYSTGKKHGGQIDILGLDENNCPVIIQHRRGVSDGVVDQGLDLLTWMMSNQYRINALVGKKFGVKAVSTIAWRNPRLICISEDFNSDDVQKTPWPPEQQSYYSVDFFRYKIYGTENLIIERLSSAERANFKPIEGTSFTFEADGSMTTLTTSEIKSAATVLRRCNDDLQACFHQAYDFLRKLDDKIDFRVLGLFFAFVRIKNFVRVVPEPRTNTLWMYVKLDPNTVDLEAGFTRDVTTKVHLATGHLEIAIRNQADLEKAKPLLLRAYQQS